MDIDVTEKLKRLKRRQQHLLSPIPIPTPNLGIQEQRHQVLRKQAPLGWAGPESGGERPKKGSPKRVGVYKELVTGWEGK